MGSRAYDPTKPTFYLDHSTLVDAFKVHLPGTNVDQAYLPLKGWVERIAVEANLCMSVVHLVELGGWGAEEPSDAMARWYGSLPIVWAPLIQHVQTDETDHWTKVAVGATGRTHFPYAASLEAAFRTLDHDGIEAMNRHGAPELALVTVARTARWRELWEERYVRRYVSMIVNVSENHRSMRETPGWTDETGRRQVTANFEESLRQRAREASIRMCVAGDPEFASSPVEGERIAEKLLELFEQNARSLPACRAGQLFTQGNADMVDRGEITDGVPSKKLLRTLRSGFGDYMHLTGAAYCDVATCDRTVSNWLGDLRTTLGLRPQLAARDYPGGPAGFVRDLMASWP
jgi:hypothetical protein